jgi:precorrin-2/cobalt-factor-2 C20-methyltransferase
MGMRKTSVYLSEQTKAALHDASVRWGRSEAEIIRQAIERHVRGGGGGGGEAANPAASRPLAERIPGPRLIGVGVGPSAPDLITQRAIDVLEQADQVFAAATAPDAIARAEAIVRVAAPTVKVDRLPLSISGDAESFERCLDAAADVLLEAIDRGRVVAYIALGDPNTFSTFPALARRVARQRPEVPIGSVPGIMSFQELAARTGTVLAEGDERVELVTLREDLSNLEAALEKPDCTLILYKGGRHLPAVAERIRLHRRLEGAVVGELMGLPGGRSGSVSEFADRPASYLATVVIPATRTKPQ